MKGGACCRSHPKGTQGKWLLVVECKVKADFADAQWSHQSVALLLGSPARGVRLHVAASSMQCLSGGAILSGTMLTPGGDAPALESPCCGMSPQHDAPGVEVFGMPRMEEAFLCKAVLEWDDECVI